MAYIGDNTTIDWDTMDAGTYYIVKDSGEVYDSVYEIENYYTWEWAEEELEYQLEEEGHPGSVEELKDSNYDEYERRVQSIIDNYQSYLEVEKRDVEPVVIYAYRDYYNPDAIQVYFLRKNELDNAPNDPVFISSDYDDVASSMRDALRECRDLSRQYEDIPVILSDIKDQPIQAWMNGDDMDLDEAFDILES